MPPASSNTSLAARIRTFRCLADICAFSKSCGCIGAQVVPQDVLRILPGLNQALSRKCSFFGNAAVFTAIYAGDAHIGSAELQIIRSEADNFSFFVVQGYKGVPSGRFFTITWLPVILSASNACRAGLFHGIKIGDVYNIADRLQANTFKFLPEPVRGFPGNCNAFNVRMPE